MLIDFKEKRPVERYFLLAETVVPRPIAWIATQGEVLNLAPFSFFTPLSSEPPTMIVSIGHRSDGTPKDTLRNLRETKKCMIALIDETHFEAMHFSSKELGPAESEAELFEIPTQEVIEGYPPYAARDQSSFLLRLPAGGRPPGLSNHPRDRGDQTPLSG